jgi:hypothetical protein
MAIDLSELGKKTGDREAIEVDAAFMVVIREGGIIQASPDINAPIVPRRDVTLEEMQTAARRVYDDIQATRVANIVQANMQQAAAQAMQQAEAQRIAGKLHL